MNPRDISRLAGRRISALAVPNGVSRPLLPGLALPARYFLGLGLLFLCLWLPAFAALFRR